jgi:ATP-dependent DNA helicase PIF1
MGFGFKKFKFSQVNEATASMSSDPSVNKFATNSDMGSEQLQIIPEYHEIKNLLVADNQIVLVTGGAGTGKSTLIRWLFKQFSGSVLLAAPTGLAALNIGGKTIHSLCRLPPTWILPQDIRVHPRSLAKFAKILIIDEISMVDANLLDGIDHYFRKNRENESPFGGVSVLMVGDLFQLPPIVDTNKEQLFKSKYSSPKFFSAKSIQDAEFHFVELTKCFRQKDEDFYSVLNKIREGQEIKESVDVINRVCRISNDPEDGYITLSPRHVQVDRINNMKMRSLTGNPMTYLGSVLGKFNEKQLPVPNKIELKLGAQVMITKNDHGYVNGDIGVITHLSQYRIKVQLLDRNKEVEVPYATWEQYDFVFDVAENRIIRKVVGTYRQLPVIPAWAMTIHKSQGLTIDKVHLDLGIGSFDTGQTYVALSRCPSWKNLTLARPLKSEDIKVDAQAVKFYAELRNQT